MTSLRFPGQNHTLPLAADPDRLALGRERWDALCVADRPDAERLRAIAACEDGQAVLAAVFGNSPYLSASLLKEPDILVLLQDQGPDQVMAGILEACRRDARTATDINALMRGLRRCKRRAALLIALADLSGQWGLEPVTEALTCLAETTLDEALRFLLGMRVKSGDLIPADPTDPLVDCSLTVLGMGKLGGRELNYSSDIDLILFFDADKVVYRGRHTAKECFVRLTRDLVRVMEERTADGYVFRTDLRLRPDPASTAVVLSTEAAEIYYETMGQNWERAAMIKARPVAGDLAVGEHFLRHLRPFVWRKSLDFNAIQDIHAIKRQIHAAKGGSVIGVAGHNIKTGRGGIREIEFYAQTQQLIWGGRNPRLRTRATCAALRDFVEAGLETEAVTAELIAAYEWLRTLEHRLQMTNDEQTQTLPKDPFKLHALAVFMGLPDTAALEAAVLERLRTVENHYAALFEDSPSLSATPGNLVFTGGEDDPETLRTLRDMGFTSPDAVSATIRGWHHGRYNATRSHRARERLTELVPAILERLSHTAQPDAALMRFDGFLKRLPTGVQLFTLFQANPQLLDLLADIMGDAPRLADHLARNPRLMDAVLTPGFFDAPPTRAMMEETLDVLLRDALVFEDVLDLVRRWTNDMKFTVGILALNTLLAPEQAGEALSDIADVALSRLLPAVEADFAEAHGHVPGGSLAILALGKLGSREMTATSDLDLIIVYDVTDAGDDDGSAESDGAKPLGITVYYTRLTQRVINAITALTNEGVLYEVDMRLRPSGNKGPLATSLTAFARYQAEGAWTWEHQALTRARVVAGPPGLRARIDEVITRTLCKHRDASALAEDVAGMRARMDRDKPAASPWDVKLAAGGLVDVDFIAQYLQLCHAHAHPRVLDPSTTGALARLAEAGLLDAGDAATLSRVHRRNLAIQATLRHTLDGQVREDQITPGLRVKLARATGQDSFDTLRAVQEIDMAEVRRLFERLVGPLVPPQKQRKDTP